MQIKINGRNIQVAEFNSRKLALGYADRSIAHRVVMLGDNSRFWVVSMANAQRLERAGYQWAI